ERHPDPELRHLLKETALSRFSGEHRVRRRGEGGAEGIADRLEDPPPVQLDGGVQEVVMALQRSPHPSRVLLPEAGRSLDGREEEGDRAGTVPAKRLMFGYHSRLPRRGERRVGNGTCAALVQFPTLRAVNRPSPGLPSPRRIPAARCLSSRRRNALFHWAPSC